MQKNNQQTIVFTGGHHNSALVVARQLAEKGYRIVWFGHQKTMWRAKSLSAEYLEVKKTGFKFIDLKAGKFHKITNPLRLAKIPFGFLQALYLLIRFRPQLIISFGGYLAVPTVLAGWLLRIPAVTHEQTLTGGRANLFLARFCKRVFVSWPEAKKLFPKDKVVITGLPLRDIFKQAGEYQPYFKNQKPTILILGGKQGCHVINKQVLKNLPELLAEYNLIHQSGYNLQTGDYKKLARKEKELPEKLTDSYLLKPYFFGEEIIRAYKTADLVVSRSGAHTLYELIYLGKPAIFIPLPFAYKDEQQKNAEKYAQLGGAKILPQEELSKLKQVIDQGVAQRKELAEHAQEASSLLQEDASKEVVRQIRQILEQERKE